MVFKHLVKYNGVYYHAGADVPAGDKPVDNKKKLDEVVEEKATLENKFTKSEITRMSTADLKEVAKLNGIENAEDMTGAKLKEVLIEKFKL
jgi:hypothetical protein